jgi:hypothetical protein
MNAMDRRRTTDIFGRLIATRPNVPAVHPSVPA